MGADDPLGANKGDADAVSVTVALGVFGARSSGRASLLLCMVCCAAGVAAPGALAVVTASVSNGQLLVTGDSSSESITVSYNSGTGFWLSRSGDLRRGGRARRDPRLRMRDVAGWYLPKCQNPGTVTSIVVNAGAGDDTVSVSPESAMVAVQENGQDGNDTLNAPTQGVATLDGGPGNDTLYGSTPPLTELGGDGNDVLWAGEQGGTLNGGAGDDQINDYPFGINGAAYGTGPDDITCGTGSDTVSYLTRAPRPHDHDGR